MPREDFKFNKNLGQYQTETIKPLLNQPSE